MSVRYSRLQPVAGETVLHCDHAREPDNVGRTFRPDTHWFKVDAPFTAPAGETGIASWLVCCDGCWRAVGYDISQLQKVEVGGHVVWAGNVPVIVEAQIS